MLNFFSNNDNDDIDSVDFGQKKTDSDEEEQREDITESVIKNVKDEFKKLPKNVIKGIFGR